MSVSNSSTPPPARNLFGRLAREFLSQTTQARLCGYTHHRVAWVKECLQWSEGEGPTSYQEEVLRRFDQGLRRQAVRGPHSLGKTALAAWLVLHFALTREAAGVQWKVVTTASVHRQLTLFLWPEIKLWARRLNWEQLGRAPFDPRTELLEQHLKLDHGQAFAVASDRPENIEGAHAEHLLYVFDEAKAIPPPIWDAAEGALSGQHCYALAISTPGEPQGRFYDIHSRKPGFDDWHVTHISLDQCLEAGRVDREWARNRLDTWHCEYARLQPDEKPQTNLERLLGVRIIRPSAMFANRALGEFASSEDEGLIPLAWIEAANERWREIDEAHDWPAFTCVGVDVGRGGDASVLALRYGNALRELRPYGIPDTMVITGNVVPILRSHGGYAVVDVVGVGSGVVDRLREQKFEVVAFNAGESTDWKDRSGEMLFANKRSAAWWNLRELLDPANEQEIALPADDLLTGDLTAPHWRMSSGGRIVVESKEEIRKRIGRSTDHGDAVVQAFWQEPEDIHVFRIGRAKPRDKAPGDRRGRVVMTKSLDRKDRNRISIPLDKKFR
ncbi:MAG: hypothetical protein JW990_21400 [Thermoleophilia bacterium]|nr:hypothetical protein [Thermoleophilia bacterium]